MTAEIVESTSPMHTIELAGFVPMPGDAASRAFGLAKLREPFPQESVGKLPKAGITLDYIGHAVVTDRLLSIDPEWNWEPMAVDDRGLPAFDNAGNLWIKLTVLGITRLGVGDGPDPKQRISDAIRNAAMRFGVALDLWSKDELESLVDHDAPARSPEQTDNRRWTARADVRPPSDKQISFLNSLLNQTGSMLFDLADVIGREVVTAPDLTGPEAKKVIDHLINVRDGKVTAPAQPIRRNTAEPPPREYLPDEEPF